jgi:nucleotide-binding universal stress UspA family protein
MMYRSIMVPLDGSAFGEYALPFALGLARRAGAQLHLVHVHAPPTAALAETDDAALRAAHHMYLEGLVQRVRASWDVPITTIQLDGPIAETLHEYAVKTQADLIAMTTHGRGALSRFWLGSVADTLIRQVSMPLLLVRPHAQPLDLAHEPAIKHMLVPLDRSELAERLLGHATTFGRTTQARYTLLQVVTPEFIGYGTELYALSMENRFIEELQSKAQAYLERVALPLRADGLKVETATAVDLAGTAILNYAQEHAVDLIALATHARTGLARLLIGSVADKVIRGATVPVLLYRPQEGAGPAQ